MNEITKDQNAGQQHEDWLTDEIKQSEAEYFHPLQYWRGRPITEERAIELVDILTRPNSDIQSYALLELIASIERAFDPKATSEDQNEADMIADVVMRHAYMRTSHFHNSMTACLTNSVYCADEVTHAT